MQRSQHDDESRDARQLPSGVILSRGPGNLGSAPSHATKPGSVPEEDQSPAQDDESGNKKAPPDRWLGTSHNAGCLVFAMIVVVGSIIVGKACTVLTSQ